ncbi:MAG: SpoIID/LytB domain-containing protein [Acidobacteriota bacterium]|nr:SpoIID/LytB domain-containing protein [Acidobacteriota bacterium]
MNFRRIQIGCLIILFSFAFSCGGRKAQPRTTPGARPTTSSKKPAPATAKPDKPTPDTAPIGASGEGPIIRIGLYTAAKELRISSSEDYYVLDKISETSQQQIRGEIRIQIEQDVAATTPVYQVQVVSLSNPENAKELKESLAGRLGLPTAIRVNPSNGISQIRVGEFSTREEAQAYLPNIQPDYPDAFVIEREGATSKAGGDRTEITLSGADGLRLTSRAGFRVLPGNAASFLRVGGKTYRGSFDIFLGKSDRITLVNQLPVEDYLLGVVPAEMSPSHFPEFDALAAQAIAARTYALKNMGRFRSDGFDLTDDTRTQVYGGVGMEKPMTSEIVRKTSGIAVYYDGKPIDAMFMSTCGGRTEDVALVYGSQPVPYLKSVVCAIEHGPDATGVRLAGAHPAAGTFRTMDGSLANRNLELARVLKLLPEDATVTPVAFAEPIRKDEAKRWIQAAASIAKPSRRVAPQDSGIESRGGFLRQAVDAFFGEEEIQRRISQADTDYYMASLTDGSEVPPSLRPVLSYLIQRKLWRPTVENTAAADSPIRRGDALALLVDWVEAEKPEILRQGDFVENSDKDRGGATASTLKIKSGGKTRDFALAKNPCLFRVDREIGAGGGRVQITSVPGLKLVGTEKLSFHLNDKDAIDFMEIELSPSGAASDRFSSAATWKTTLSRSTVAEKLRSLISDMGALGALRDLQPALLGQSGRVVQIQAVGASKSVVLNGYRVRGALGLQDTLFTLTREFGADGDVTSFTFSGRGSGHGIGLCQTGAFGMAKAGKSYEEILKTYYTGVDIRKAY